MHQPPMIRDDIRIMWPCIESAMNGKASNSVTKIARIFGPTVRCERSASSWFARNASASALGTKLFPESVRGRRTLGTHHA